MVQQFREREVQQSGQVPGYQNVSYPADAFGAAVGRALSQAGNSLQDFGSQIAQIDAQKKANDALDVRNHAADELRKTLYSPESGIFAAEGKNAMDATKRLDGALETIQKNIIDRETDPQTQQVLKKLWQRETEAAKDKVAVHQLNELGKYKVETSKATMYGAMEDAYNNYNDDKSIEAAINRSFEAIDVNASGLPKESLDLMKAEAKSNIRLAAISRWASEDPGKALEYYTAHKDDLSGKDHIAANQLVATAKKYQAINFEAAKIINGGVDDFFISKIVPVESGGDPNAVSASNAIGLSQITLPTARDMARLTGNTELLTLSDAELKDKLKNDPELNLQLGKARWNEQLNRLGGDVEAALVAYNAGPKAADAFLAHNAGKPPGQRDYDVPGWKGIKSETEGYVKKILGQGPQEVVPGQRMTAANWTLKNFKPEDLTAPTPGGAWVDARAATALDKLTDTMKQRFRGFQIRINEERDPNGVTAGRRRGTADPADNPHVKKSQHLKGTAFDVQIQNWTTEEKQAFIAEARKLGFKGFGFYGPQGHLHIDMGAERTWGRVPTWATESLKTPLGTTVAETPQEYNRTGTLAANSTPGYFIDTKKTALSQWMAQADAIADPEVRQGVQAQIKIAAATMDAQRDAETAEIKQSAWDVVANGGSISDFRPDQLSKMDPSFLNTLAEFEAKRKRGDTATDWTAYAQLQSLSEEDFAKTDIMTEYGTKLGPVELKGELIRQRETKAKLMGKDHDEELLANTRTRREIVDDVASSQGWKKDSPEFAMFNRRLDERILGEQAIKKSKLNAVEIQDIADKMLIEDKYSSMNPFSSGYYVNQGLAMDATSPDEFVAANTWDEVQPDDQKVLIERFERMRGRLPDEEEATDTYNRAIRVWLGGKPDGPEEEKTRLREKVEAKRGQVTDEYFEAFYGQYLLNFLGR